MQEEIINYKIRGLGNLIEPISINNFHKINIDIKDKGNHVENGYSYKQYKIGEGGEPEPIDSYTKEEFQALLSTKERILKSKENIKTIEDKDVLGQGNIEIDII